MRVLAWECWLGVATDRTPLLTVVVDCGGIAKKIKIGGREKIDVRVLAVSSPLLNFY